MVTLCILTAEIIYIAITCEHHVRHKDVFYPRFTNSTDETCTLNPCNVNAMAMIMGYVCDDMSNTMIMYMKTNIQRP